MSNGAAAPQVDVVIATHDRPALVREAVAAVVGQDYPGPIRCIVVFDRSDPDPALISTEPGRRVDVVANERTPGLAGARNTGIMAGSGELIAFCDDDDVWLPHKLAPQVALLETGGPPTCVTGIEVVYDGRTTTRVPAPEDLELRNLVRRRVMEAHPSTVLVRRRELLRDIGLVDEELPGSYGEDFDWMIRAAAAGFHVVPAALVRVRWGGSQFSRAWGTIVEAIDYGLAKHQVFHEDRRALARLLGRKSFALAALGRRRDALTWASRTAWTSPMEPRAYLAAAVALRMASADRLLDLAHRRGHGI